MSFEVVFYDAKIAVHFKIVCLPSQIIHHCYKLQSCSFHTRCRGQISTFFNSSFMFKSKETSKSKQLSNFKTGASETKSCRIRLF